MSGRLRTKKHERDRSKKRWKCLEEKKPKLLTSLCEERERKIRIVRDRKKEEGRPCPVFGSANNYLGVERGNG